MLVPLLIDEVLLDHPGKLTALMNRLFGASAPTWVSIAAVLALIFVLRGSAFFCNNRKSFHSIKITQLVSYQLRRQILDHLEHVSLAEYETLKSGGIAARTVQDVETISAFAGQLVTTLLSASLMLIGIAVIMLKMNWILAILVFLLNPFFLAFSRMLGRKTGQLLRKQHQAYQLYHELLNETLELFIQVRAAGQEHYFFGLLRKRAKNIETASIDYGYKAAVAGSSSAFLTSSVVDLFRALGIVAVVYSDLSIGMMIAFLFYLSTLVAPIQQLMGLVIAYQSARPGIQRVNRLFSLAREPEYPAEINPFLPSHPVSVELRNISFCYVPGRPVLHGVNLKIPAGHKIALIGPSGSGKTTLGQVMVGFYPVHSGVLLYNGVPMEKIGLQVIRRHVALVLQQTLFLNDTIRVNLTLSGEKSDTELHAALQAAQLDNFVRNLADGLESRIGKNGIRLSGGQLQRLAIARVILADPKVVIFDESSSALDNMTESRLYESLEPFFRGRTTIIIAHRTTTIQQADYVYLIEHGMVTAQGTCADLQVRGLIREDFDSG